MTWKPPENTSDLDRINNLLKHYERVNLDQIQQIENLNQTHDANAKRILELEKNKKALIKNVKSLEGRMKFDKIAADGIKKKFNLLELEVRELKHANEQFGIERSEDKARILQLEEDLNNNRSDKLKFMHENSNLKKQNAELMVDEKNASGDALVARKDTLQKLEMVDHLLALNETYKRTIAAQSEEVLSLSHEQHDLNERLMHSKKQVVSLEVMTAEYNKTIDILQHEISRLRKELMNAANAVSTKSSAVLSRSGAKNKSNSISTTIINSSYSGEEDGPYALNRRPYSHISVSRDRNRLKSSSVGSGSGTGGAAKGGSWYQDSGLLPALSESAAAISSSLRQPPGEKYRYVDLTEHLHASRESQQGSMVLVDGGAISTGPGQSVHTTLRSHILHGYEEALAPAPGKSSEPLAASMDGSAAMAPAGGVRGEYMCSPVSTPFRKAAVAQSPLRPLPLSLAQHAQSLKGGATAESGYKLSDSVTQLKKCYSAPVRALDPSKAQNKNQQYQDHPHSPITVDSEAPYNNYTSATYSPPTTAGTGDNTSAGAGTVRFAQQQQAGPTSPSSRAPAKRAGASSTGAAASVTEASGKKSLFVGAGLGLKHNEALDAELRNLNKGSTHQLLKKILGDRFD